MELLNQPLFGTKRVCVCKAHWCDLCGYQVQIGYLAIVATDMVKGAFKHKYYHPECYQELQRNE